MQLGASDASTRWRRCYKYSRAPSIALRERLQFEIWPEYTISWYHPGT